MDIISFVDILNEKAPKTTGLESLAKNVETWISDIMLGVGNKLSKINLITANLIILYHYQ